MQQAAPRNMKVLHPPFPKGGQEGLQLLLAWHGDQALLGASVAPGLRARREQQYRNDLPVIPL